MLRRICIVSQTAPVRAEKSDGLNRTKAYLSRLQLLSTFKKIVLLSVPSLFFFAALRAFPIRLSFLSVVTVLHPFLATARARRILTAFVAVAFITVDSARDAFRSAGQAMALFASPDS